MRKAGENDKPNFLRLTTSVPKMSTTVNSTRVEAMPQIFRESRRVHVSTHALPKHHSSNCKMLQ